MTKRFGGARPALDRLYRPRRSRARSPGLVGPDGAGKTTLMRLMAGLLLPDEGRVTVCGLDTGREAAAMRRVVGYMPQTLRALRGPVGAGESRPLRRPARRRRRGAARRPSSGCWPSPTWRAFTDRLAGKLSGGMKQKLGLACALIGTPRLLLLDEPSVGVDPISRRELWRMVNDLVDQRHRRWSGARPTSTRPSAAPACCCSTRASSLYAGPPGELTATGRRAAASRSPVAGHRRHGSWPAALKLPEVIDGVIQGSSVRLVLRRSGPPPDRGAFGRRRIAQLEPVAAALRGRLHRPARRRPRRRLGAGRAHAPVTATDDGTGHRGRAS